MKKRCIQNLCIIHIVRKFNVNMLFGAGFKSENGFGMHIKRYYKRKLLFVFT